MKVKVDIPSLNIIDKPVYELTDIHQAIIQNDIHADIFFDDMQRRLRWVLEHKLERCQERLIKEWHPKLSESHASLPTCKDALCEIIFSDPEYKCRKQREIAEKQQREG